MLESIKSVKVDGDQQAPSSVDIALGSAIHKLQLFSASEEIGVSRYPSIWELFKEDLERASK